MNDPLPLEQSDPELGEQIRLIANRDHPVVRGYSRSIRSSTYFLRTGQRVMFKTDIGRNSPCPCGSGKKFKKCCG